MAGKEPGKSEFSSIVSSTATANNLLLAYASRHSMGLASTALFGVRYYERPADDHPIYSFVGRVASEWAHFEHVLDEIIWDLANLNHIEGACITAQLMGVAPRYRTIIAQLTRFANADTTYKKFIDNINQLMSGSYEPQDERNRIVHDPWYVTFDPNFTLLPGRPNERAAQFKSMPHKDLRFGVMDVDLTQIEQTIVNIKSLSERAKAIHERIKTALEASRGKRS